MKVVIIGTGNVATVFGRLLISAGVNVLQVYGRNPEWAGELAAELGSTACSSWDQLNKNADVYLVALADRLLRELHKELRLSGQLVLHTAGSVSKDVLKGISKDYGVLYPLQSLRREMPVLTSIPLLVEASSTDALERTLALARRLSPEVFEAGEEQRFKLHVAAVFLNNFANHLYTLTENFCSKENVDFRLLFPLLSETAKRVEIASPATVQTGPAIRRDGVTIQTQLELLQTHPRLQSVYLQLTKSIREYYEGSR